MKLSTVQENIVVLAVDTNASRVAQLINEYSRAEKSADASIRDNALTDYVDACDAIVMEAYPLYF